MASGTEDTGPFAFVAEDCIAGTRVDLIKDFIDQCPYPEVPPDVLTEEYFVSRETVQQPCNPIEELIAELLERPDVVDIIGNVAGAQWSWHDYLDSDEPKVYHTDCNRRLIDGRTYRTNPQWSSVVYLTDEGGGTVVWRDSEFAACQPYRGRYLVFRGDLPHGVLCAYEPKGVDRIILSITWWDRSEDATGSRHRPSWSSSDWKPRQLTKPSSSENEDVEGKDKKEHVSSWSSDLFSGFLDAVVSCLTRSKGKLLFSNQIEGFDRRLLTPLIGAPIAVPFSEHVEDWRAQRMPVDLRSARKDGEPPTHLGIIYSSDSYDPRWCPLVDHAQNEN
eukprot:TRINITY_DN39432_c0_g1_i1.p1 TRINITY_DN39432_c0_g1~~TRINITY_DN39432_c0_g1_i1.p1  ORF type:complete len:333 (-),score=46.18 TRINITY_DN39432_c0_g1_i1:317-1315(-)